MSAPSAKWKIIVGGGTGFIGSALSSHLKQLGHDVIVVSRTAGTGRMTWGDIQRNGLPTGTDAVVNVSGRNVLSGLWTESFRQELISSRVHTTKMLRDAIAQAASPPKVFVTQSAVGYYKTSQEQVYDETNGVPGNDWMANLVRDWEEAGNLPEGHPTRRVATRTGVVLARHGGMIKQIYWPFSLGLGGPLGSGKQPFPWIALEDEVGIFAHCMFEGEARRLRGVLNAVAPQIVTNQEFSEAVAKALHRPCFFRVPEFVIKAAVGKERAVLLLEGQKVAPTRTLESGYRFKYPTLETCLAHIMQSPS